jgi:membrane protease YdiL (CAAX protease family)
MMPSTQTPPHMTHASALSRPAARLLTFGVGAALSIVVGIFTAGSVAGMSGSSGGRLAMPLASAIIAGLLLALSSWLLKHEGTSLHALGLTTEARRGEFVFGFVIGLVLYVALTLVQSLAVSAPWLYQGVPGTAAALAWLVPVSTMVLAEEVLFRGVALRSLRQLYGDWPAIILSALLFGAYHLVGSGDWAIGAFFRFTTSAAGGLLFAWMAVRSGGLALPFGLHLGGNWVQASIAVMSPAPSTEVTSMWRIPITSDDVTRLTTPDVLPRLPFFVMIACAVALTVWFLRARRTDSLITT